MKEILLKHCHECPYLFDDGGELTICKKKFGKPFDICSFKDFPDWCPLLDAPQQTNSADAMMPCALCGQNCVTVKRWVCNKCANRTAD